MTRIEFIINVENKFAKAAALCEKEVAKGRLVTFSSENETHFTALQTALWQVSASSFLPIHMLENTPDTAHFATFSPIHFALPDQVTAQNKLLQDDVLVHFYTQTPPFFSRFRYLVELVGVEEADKAAARLRYKFYRDRGYDIKTTHVTDN
jgi:DNA polymerase III subunit chi